MQYFHFYFLQIVPMLLNSRSWNYGTNWRLNNTVWKFIAILNEQMTSFIIILLLGSVIIGNFTPSDTTDWIKYTFLTIEYLSTEKAK